MARPSIGAGHTRVGLIQDVYCKLEMAMRSVSLTYEKNNVTRDNLECGTFFSFLLWNKDCYRLALWDGIGRYTSGLQVSESIIVGIPYTVNFMQINLSDSSRLLTMAHCTSN